MGSFASDLSSLTCIFHRPYVFVTGDANLIQETCKSTKYYELCLLSLKSDPTSLNADTKGLAVIMVGIGMANGTAASSFLSSQLLSTTNDTILKKVLKECVAKYAYAGDALQASAQDLIAESNDYATCTLLQRRITQMLAAMSSNSIQDWLIRQSLHVGRRL